MARPQKLQRLRHGRILSAGAFPGFVATWNWLCGIVESWVGDQDLGGDGCIHVDRTNADVPVIRLDMVKLGRKIRVENIPEKGCWRIVGGSASVEVADSETGDTQTLTTGYHYLDRQYFRVGGMLFEGEDLTTLESLIEDGKPFVAAKITATGSGYSAAVVGFEDFAAMKAASFDRTFSLIPLYELEEVSNHDGSAVDIAVKVDFRAMPLIQAFELPTEGGVA
jgi:hypothetical protein